MTFVVGPAEYRRSSQSHDDNIDVGSGSHEGGDDASDGITGSEGGDGSKISEVNGNDSNGSTSTGGDDACGERPFLDTMISSTFRFTMKHCS